MKRETPALPGTKDFLERVRVQIARVRGLPMPASGYRVAKEIGLAETAVARWKKGAGTMSNSIGIRVADYIGLPRAYVVVCLMAERERVREVREVWEGIAAVVAPKASSKRATHV